MILISTQFYQNFENIILYMVSGILSGVIARADEAGLHHEGSSDSSLLGECLWRDNDSLFQEGREVLRGKSEQGRL